MLLHDITIQFVLSLAAAVSAGVFAWAARMVRDSAAPTHWALACAGISLSSLSPLVVSDPYDPWRPILFNLPLLAGYAFWLSGTRRFCERPRRDGRVFGVAGAGAVLSLLFTLVWPDRVWRVSAIGLTFLLLRGSTAITLWRHADRRENPVARVLSGVLWLECVVLLLRVVDVWTGGALPIGASGGGGLGNFTWLGTLLTVIVGTPLLMLLGLGRMIERLREAAHHDQLTGLLNRRGFELALAPLLAREQRRQPRRTVLMIDIDHFKAINDRHGHAVGDAALRSMGAALRCGLRGGDLAMRCGGEEFCVLLGDSDAALTVAERVRAEFRQRCSELPALAAQTVTASIGIAHSDDLELPFAALQERADQALYAAKQAGRDRVVVAADSGHGELAC